MRSFLVRRLFRVLPVYWAGMVIYTAVFGLETRGWLPGPEVWHYPVFLAAVNIFLPTATSSVVPGGWYISVEVVFYLTAPHWFIYVRRLKSSVIFTAIAAVIAMVTLSFGPLISKHYYPEIPWYYWYRLPTVHFFCFGLGMVAYFLLERHHEIIARKSVHVMALSGLVLFLVLSTALDLLIPDIGYPLASFCAILVLAGRSYRVFVNPVFTFIGRISFSAYLLHFLVIRLLHDFLPLPDGNLRIITLAAIAFPITMAISWVSWKLVEVPASKLGRTVNRLRDSQQHEPA